MRPHSSRPSFTTDTDAEVIYKEVQTCQPPTVKNLEVDRKKKPRYYDTSAPLIGKEEEKKVICKCESEFYLIKTNC